MPRTNKFRTAKRRTAFFTALVAGGTVAEAAKVAKMNPRSAYTWATADASFAVEFAETYAKRAAAGLAPAKQEPYLLTTWRNWRECGHPGCGDFDTRTPGRHGPHSSPRCRGKPPLLPASAPAAVKAAAWRRYLEGVTL